MAVPESVETLLPLVYTESESSCCSYIDTESPDRIGDAVTKPVLVVETPDRSVACKSHSGLADQSRVVLHADESGDVSPIAASTTVCRFDLFSKTRQRVPAAQTEEDTTRLRPGGFQRLPSMNVRTATQITVSDQESSMMSRGMHSILPPPTLHFSLSNITRLSSILADPSLYVDARPGNGPGGVTRNVDLLVVIKDIVDVSRVRARFPVDRPPISTSDQGKTDRMELTVLDGSLQSGEKHMFRVVLWGNLARQWTTEADNAQDVSDSSISAIARATSRDPTALRAGDVIYIANIGLSAVAPDTSSKRPRLGAGFPPRIPVTCTTSLVANGSEYKSTSLELCYRSNALDRYDQARNFDTAIAQFDPKSRRLLELSRLWN